MEVGEEDARAYCEEEICETIPHCVEVGDEGARAYREEEIYPSAQGNTPDFSQRRNVRPC